DEDDGGRVLSRFGKEIADARGADTDDHFHELCAAHREERNVRLPRHGAGEKRLSGAGGADQQNALRGGATEARVLLRVLEEIDDFGELLLRLIDSGH